MNDEKERDLFLKYLSDIIIQNPNFNFTYDTIYDLLTKFNVQNNAIKFVEEDNLVPVQTFLRQKLYSKYNTFSNGYFFVLENRCGKSDREFYNELISDHTVKLYIPVSTETIKDVSEKLFNFMLEENISTQSKISKNMRTDALVVRLTNENDAKKVCDFINKLNYKCDNKVNPFFKKNGKVGLMDVLISSDNITLSKLIYEYLMLMKNKNRLSDISFENFESFIKNRAAEEDKINFEVSLEDKDKLLSIISFLSEKYGNLNSVHDGIILKYINTGDINLFTRDKGIRCFIEENYPPEVMKKIIISLGYDAIIDASRETYLKYGEANYQNAINKLVTENRIDCFTRDNNARSKLGFIASGELLKFIVDDITINSDDKTNDLIKKINNEIDFNV